MLLMQSSIRGMGNVSILVTYLLYSSLYTCETSRQVLVQEYKENSIHFD